MTCISSATIRNVNTTVIRVCRMTHISIYSASNPLSKVGLVGGKGGAHPSRDDGPSPEPHVFGLWEEPGLARSRNDMTHTGFINKPRENKRRTGNIASFKAPNMVNKKKV